MTLIHYYTSRNRKSTLAKTTKFLVQRLTRFSVHHLGNHLLRGLFNGITGSFRVGGMVRRSFHSCIPFRCGRWLCWGEEDPMKELLLRVFLPLLKNCSMRYWSLMKNGFLCFHLCWIIASCFMIPYWSRYLYLNFSDLWLLVWIDLSFLARSGCNDWRWS